MHLRKVLFASLAFLLVLVGCSSGPSKGDEMYEKYKDLIDALEAENYEGAMQAFSSYIPQPETETITLSTENWSDYFDLSIFPTYEKDAQGNINTVHECYVLTIKPEYEGKCSIEGGFVGYEYDNQFCKITDLRSDGSYDFEPIDNTIGYAEEWLGHKSESSDLYPSKTFLNYFDYIALRGDGSSMGGSLPVSDAANYESLYVIRSTSVDIVNVSGTLTIRN